MKKTISILLCMVLLAALALPVCAEERPETPENAGKETLTRGEFVMGLFSISVVTDMEPRQAYYEDVPMRGDLALAVRWAVDAGIVKGYGDGRFGPDDPVTREQMAAMLYRYAQTLGLGFKGLWVFPLDYPDAAEVSDWADEAMHWVVMKGILLGTDKGLEPKALATDDQLALVLQRFSAVYQAEQPKEDTGLYAAVQTERPSPDWVTALPSAQDENVRQLFVVAGMGMEKTTATISMHERDENGQWVQVLSTPGFVGRNGLCPDAEHKEGCGQTPIGVYTFNKALGIAADPGCAIPYTRATDDIYWSGDMRDGMRYNEMVRLSEYPDLDTENSEHIVDYEYEYQYVLNISFNAEGTPGRGSAIFLHCFGLKKPQTGGCVAIPEYIMKQVMQRVSPDCVVVIDTLEQMGGSL